MKFLKGRIGVPHQAAAAGHQRTCETVKDGSDIQETSNSHAPHTAPCVH